jgi:hypothetical protein
VYGYTGFGEVRSHLRSGHGVEQYQYDSLGRLTQVGSDDGLDTWTYDGAGPNEVGRLVQSQGSTGRTTHFYYEPVVAGANRGLLSRAEYAGSTDAPLEVGFTYDTFGRPETTVYPASGQAALTVRQNYDNFDNLLSVSKEGASLDYWRWTASDEGYRVRTERFGNGLETTREYDSLTGRTNRISTSAPAGLVQDLRYKYDAAGNVKSRFDALGGVDGHPYESFTYDAQAGARAAFRDAGRVAAEYGGSPADWVKMSSSGFRAADGTTFATHWVENIFTGQQVESKVVIDVFGGP